MVRFTDLKRALRQSCSNKDSARVWVIDGYVVTDHFMVAGSDVYGAPSPLTTETLCAAMNFTHRGGDAPEEGFKAVRASVKNIPQDKTTRYETTPLRVVVKGNLCALYRCTATGKWLAVNQAFLEGIGEPPVLWGSDPLRNVTDNPESDTPAILAPVDVRPLLGLLAPETPETTTEASAA